MVKTKIFLADERGCSKSDYFAAYHTFNFGHFQNEHKKPFQKLHLLNEVHLKANHALKMSVDKNCILLLLPLLGGLEYNIDAKNDFIEIGKLKVFDLLANDTYEIINPYPENAISYLEICIENQHEIRSHSEYNIDFSRKNELISIDKLGVIAMFSGRQKGEYLVKSHRYSTFTSVIKGAFEVSECLLHTQDGLAQSNIDKIEFEALSEDAIILILEFECQ